MILVRAAARRAIQDNAMWLLDDAGPDVAHRFVDAVRETLEGLEASPAMGPLCAFRSARLDGVRRWPVRGFPSHLIFYQVAGDDIDVIDVLHAARDRDAAKRGWR